MEDVIKVVSFEDLGNKAIVVLSFQDHDKKEFMRLSALYVPVQVDKNIEFHYIINGVDTYFCEEINYGSFGKIMSEFDDRNE